MTSDTSPYSQAPPPPPPVAPTAANGWSGPDLAVGGALVVLLIALFLPWFSGTSEVFRPTAAADGPTAHGYLWIVFVLVIVALSVLVARDVIDGLPGNLPSSAQMLVGATGLALLLTILGLLQRPSFGVAVSASWSYGGFIALVAALIAFFAASGTAARVARASLRRVHNSP